MALVCSLDLVIDAWMKRVVTVMIMFDLHASNMNCATVAVCCSALCPHHFSFMVTVSFFTSLCNLGFVSLIFTLVLMMKHDEAILNENKTD